METGITTLTFFKVDDINRAVDQLHTRLRERLQKNPWLAGRLMWIKGKKRLQLVYPNQVTEQHHAALLNRHSSIKVNSKTPYATLVKRLSQDRRICVPSAFATP